MSSIDFSIMPNVQRGCFYFRMLIYLLENSREPLILSVAAHDVGEFVRHYPRGKQYVLAFLLLGLFSVIVIFIILF